MMAPPSTVTLDIAQRGALLVLLLFLALWVWVHHRQHLAARLGAAFALGVACNALYFMPGFPASPPQWWQAPILALGVSNAALFWMFASALFDDGFRLRWFHLAAWAFVGGLAVDICHVLQPAGSPWAATLGWIPGAAALLFGLLSIMSALRTWREDLVERRRNLRLFIVVAAGAHVLLSSLAQMALHPAQRPAWFGLVDVMAMLVIALIILWRVVAADAGELFGPVPGRDHPATTVQPPSAPVDSAGDARAAAALRAAGQSPAPQLPAPPADRAVEAPDPQALARLMGLMREQRIYRQEGLSIGLLSAKMRMPEHQLRRLINQGLGYRNFASFLNEYRLADAQAALRDPAQAERSILDIAMDCGFASLGPFNRAFRQASGMTPSAWRKG